MLRFLWLIATLLGYPFIFIDRMKEDEIGAKEKFFGIVFILATFAGLGAGGWLWFSTGRVLVIVITVVLYGVISAISSAIALSGWHGDLINTER